MSTSPQLSLSPLQSALSISSSSLCHHYHQHNYHRHHHRNCHHHATTATTDYLATHRNIFQVLPFSLSSFSFSCELNKAIGSTSTHFIALQESLQHFSSPIQSESYWHSLSWDASDEQISEPKTKGQTPRFGVS